MATCRSRKNSPYLRIRWYDEMGIRHEESTDQLVRPNGQITPCTNTKEGEKIAQLICDEIEAAKKLNLTKKHFISPTEQEHTIKEVFKHFMKNNIGKDENTIYEYKRFFKKFTETFKESDKVTIIDKIGAENWLNNLKLDTYTKKVRTEKKVIIETIPYSQNTIYSYQKVLKKFLMFMFEYDYLKYFVLNKDIQVNVQVNEKIIFTNKHIKKIFENLPPLGDNFTTCIYLLAYSGLRPGDILTITVDKIDLENEVMSYYSPRLKKHLFVPIHPELLPVLAKRVFEVGKGKILGYSDHRAINKAFKRYLKSIEIIDAKYSPRTFRKSFDTWAYKNGMDTLANSRLVGHGIVTAEKHYREVDVETLRKQLKKFKIPTKPTKMGALNGGTATIHELPKNKKAL